MTDLIASLSRPEFSPEFVQWLATAPMEEIEGAYAENYKDAHGIKARWVYGAGITREQFANDFVSLGKDIQESIEADKARDAAFLARVEALGLKEWAERNEIRCEMDLWEYNYRHDAPVDVEAQPYDTLCKEYRA